MALGSTIFRKLLVTAVLLVSVSLVSSDFLLTRYVADRERESAREEMSRVARVLAAEVARGPADLEAWARDCDQRSGYRVTVIDSAGVVLADSQHDPESMENHRGRPEVRVALGGGDGSDLRRSATLDVDFLYFATPVDSPGAARRVLRLAVPLERIAQSILSVRLLILRASLIAMVLALLVAFWISHRFTQRIDRIQQYAGELVNANYSGSMVVESDDELGSVVRSLRMMAEQFRGMIARLSKESARREAIMSSMVEGVLAVDQNLHVKFCNEAFAEAVGAQLPVAENTSLAQLVRDPAVRDLLQRVASTGERGRERLSLIRTPGRTYDVQAVPFGEEGRAGALATFHDITELVRLERVRKDFIANISHELRTPLSVIAGYTETLMGGALEDPENNRRFLEIIRSHTARLSDVAADVLTLADLDNDRGAVPSERVSVLAVANSALRHVEAEAQARGVHAFLGEAEDAYVKAQKFALERAILNLLQNAIKYNREKGEVRVEVRRGDGSVRISVHDTGIGIPREDLSRIFERFYRVDKARSRETGGTGLGLSIVKNAAERMGGYVTVKSEPGKGSVFTLVLPGD